MNRFAVALCPLLLYSATALCSDLVYIASCSRNQAFERVDNHFGLIECEGKYYTVSELAQGEREGTITPDQTRAALKYTEDIFRAISGPYMDEVAATRTHVLDIVLQWCEDRGRHDSLLTHWKHVKVEELKSFHEITSFVILEQFLRDLRAFLADFITSLPKTVEAKLPHLHERLQREFQEHPGKHFVIKHKKVEIVDCLHLVDVAGMLRFISNINLMLKGGAESHIAHFLKEHNLPGHIS